MPKLWRWNLKKLLKYDVSIHWDFDHCLAHRDIKEALRKKNQGNKIKDSGEANNIN